MIPITIIALGIVVLVCTCEVLDALTRIGNDLGRIAAALSTGGSESAGEPKP